MVYCDTSFLVPLVVPEQTSDQVIAFMAGIGERDEPASSRWTMLAFVSMVGRRIRMGELPAEASHRVVAGFDALVGSIFTIVLPDNADFDLARRYLVNAETGLRAGDALHLAIAANRGAERILTLDRGMLKAGAILGLPVETGIALD